MRATLDDSSLGFERERDLIRLARKMQLGTVGFVACADEARAMIMAGARFKLPGRRFNEAARYDPADFERPRPGRRHDRLQDEPPSLRRRPAS